MQRLNHLAGTLSASTLPSDPRSLFQSLVAPGLCVERRGERRAKRVRSSALFGVYPRDLTALRDWEGLKQLWDQATQIGQTIGPRPQDNDSN